MTNSNQEDLFKELISIINLEKPSKLTLSKLKIKLCTKHKVKKIPTDIEILMNTPAHLMPKIKKLIQTKPTRTISGVAVVAVMTKPYPCPHGKCNICLQSSNSISSSQNVAHDVTADVLQNNDERNDGKLLVICLLILFNDCRISIGVLKSCF